MYLTAEAIKANPWIPHCPTLKQLGFLSLRDREALYGGAAGGGKSDALLTAALMFADEPGYSALLFRRTYADLARPGALMDRAHDWLGPTAAKWNEQTKTWTFPSRATLTFGYMDGPRDHFRYQGSEAQFCGFDELTQFREEQYTYMFSRLRRREGSRVPIRMRAASNPGGEGHGWVFERFVVPDSRRVFIPALLKDNPHLDQAGYRDSLLELDDVTRKQLLEGLWVTDRRRKPFKREWWQRANRYDAGDKAHPSRVSARWISWDTALKDKEENAYTACVVAELLPDYRLAIREVWRGRPQFPELPNKIWEFASRYNRDGKLREVLIEDKASGTSAYQTLRATATELRNKLVAFQPHGDKQQRWSQAAVWCKRGCVLLPEPSFEAPWLYNFEAELLEVPDTRYADQADAFSQLVIYLEPLLAEGWRFRGRPDVAPGGDSLAEEAA